MASKNPSFFFFTSVLHQISNPLVIWKHISIPHSCRISSAHSASCIYFPTTQWPITSQKWNRISLSWIHRSSMESFVELVFYLPGAEEVARTQFCSCFPALPGMMLILLLLFPQMAHPVEHRNIFLQLWGNSTGKVNWTPQLNLLKYRTPWTLLLRD